MTQEKIARINELAAKSRTEQGLTEEEQTEQAAPPGICGRDEAFVKNTAGSHCYCEPGRKPYAAEKEISVCKKCAKRKMAAARPARGERACGKTVLAL